RGGTTRIPPGQDIIVIDTPPATEPLAQQVLVKSTGVVLCTLADSLALSTLPMATRAVKETRQVNPDLDLLGVVVNVFDSTDLGQTRAVSQLRGSGGLFVEPMIPLRNELREWAFQPGADLPEGPGKTALKQLADTFRDQMVESGWPHLAGSTRREGAHAYAASR
ncbi:MAG: ParA family protein, partial [Gemmataceae bacterium]